MARSPTCDRAECSVKATAMYWVQNDHARHVRFCCNTHCRWARALLRETQPDSVMHRHSLKDGVLKLPALPAGQQNGEREHMLSMIIDVPHYGKPDQDHATARSILRTLQVSLHSKVEMELIDDEGNITPVEVGDDHGI